MGQLEWLLFAIFIAINFLNFVPSYFLNKNKKKGSLGSIKKLNLQSILKNIIRRFNYDFFRFNVDLSVLLLLVFYLKIDQKVATWLFFIFFLFGFIYFVYYHIIKKTYNSEPLLISDINFLKIGLTLAIGGFLHYTILFFIGLIILIVSYYFASAFFINMLYDAKSLSIPLFATTVVSSLIGLFSAVKYFNHPTIFGFLSCPSPSIHFLTNLFNSFIALKSIKTFKKINFKALQEVDVLKMKEQPNFHFLVSESYGKIFYKRVIENDKLKRKCIEIERELASKDWGIVSNFSHAPVSGGASWLSYSTLLKGIKIESHNKYYTLLKDEKHLSYYPFLKLLSNSGYKSYILNSLGGYEKVKINWQQLMRFLGVEHVIKYKDLDYKGREFGLGPSPPDQFSLNKGFELMKESYPDNPLAYFYITQNSHALWYSPGKVLADWRMLSNEDLNDYGYIDDKELSVRYEKAIFYQLETFTDFITKLDDDNIFLIVGDHQPYSDKENESDYLTPIHIISKDQKVLSSFEKFGFTKGLIPQSGNEVYHEAVQSLLLHNLQQLYGDEAQSKITYKENGIWD